MTLRNRLWTIIFFAVLLWSAISPKDYFTWLLEVAPALIGAVVAIAALRKPLDRQMSELRTKV